MILTIKRLPTPPILLLPSASFHSKMASLWPSLPGPPQQPPVPPGLHDTEDPLWYLTITKAPPADYWPLARTALFPSPGLPFDLSIKEA